MKPKVLFFIESLQCGGAEKSLISLLPLLDYSKIDVDLMLLKRGGIFEQYIPKEVRIIDFPQDDYSIRFRIYQASFSFWLRMNRFIGKKEHGAETRWKAMHSVYSPLQKQYDVAIAYQQGFPTYYIAEKVNAGKKLAWINVDLSKAGYNSAYNTPFYNQFDRVVAVSENLKELTAADGFSKADKILAVRDILNVELIRSMSKKPQAAIQTTLPKIVTVGRMVYQKGYDIAVQTAAILRERGIDFRWYFVGDGAARGEVESLIREKRLDKHVILLGEQANPYPYMAAADIYVQTSRFEGFGLTLAEARILGKPVVSTNFPVVYDQIQNGMNGLIAEMTPESIAEKIITLMENPELRESIITTVRQENNTTSLTETKKVMEMIAGE